MSDGSSKSPDRADKQGVLLGTSRAEGRSGPRVRPQAGWRVLGLFGLLLAIVGLVDVLLHLYPPAFDSPEWEFGTVAAMMAGMPLPAIGFGALGAWILTQGGRGSRIGLAVVFFAMVVLIAAAYLLFLLNVPLAWSASSGPQGPAIMRGIVRTSVMAVGFGVAYLVGGIVLVRSLSR